MQRPWHIWSAFLACLAIVAIALGWLTYRAATLDRAETVARRLIAIEENARLALWRMDSALATLSARESARPSIAYRPFAPTGTTAKSKPGHSQPHVPSPLLAEPVPLIRLHFEMDATGKITSPRAPEGREKDWAVPAYFSSTDWDASRQLCDQIGERLNPRELIAQLPEAAPATAWQLSASALPGGGERTDPRDQPPAEAYQQSIPNAPSQAQIAIQQAISSNEYRARSLAFSQNVASPNSVNQFSSSMSDGNTVMMPIWAGDELLLARKATIDGAPIVQACWLDLPAIRKQLLGSVAELLPNARLKPAKPPVVEQAHLLASLPLELIPGDLAVIQDGSLSPMQLALISGWAAFALAAAAVGMLLWGVVSLSERRASFVSAVTHELRTPLTTFRLYSEMLSEGMVPDEASRGRYLQTLRTEADRLMHLVENVLAYARMERGRVDKRIVPASVRTLIEHAESRLRARSEQAGFSLTIGDDPNAMASIVMADASAVEQILFNLVDNACKYAAHTHDQTLVLGARQEAGFTVIYLQDRGPGIPRDDRRRLFRPFHKSAHEAAATAPGVGLGLSLSRRLARVMNGDLQLEAFDGGACFALKLKLAKRTP